MDSSFHTLTLAETARTIKSGAVSSEELTRHAIDRLETHGPTLNCVAAIYAEDAISAARESDRSRINGVIKGPLHGVPLAHKDMFYRAGWKCENGSRIRRDFHPNYTSTAITKLDDAGAIDIARLNMVEFALGITGHNEITGHVRNPWSTGHITGGSSSGSGAAVGARLITGSLGSDTGGSIRFPAACCGVTGIKPTWSRVSRYGAMPLAHSLDCIGPLARTAEDCALILGAIAGYDERDPRSSHQPVDDYAANLENSLNGRRIAVPENLFYDPVTDEIRRHMDTSLDVFRSIGAEIVAVSIPESMSVTNLLNNLITSAEGAGFHSRWLRERPQDYGTATLIRFMAGAMCPADRYQEALSLRSHVLREFVTAVFDKADVFHLPMMSFPVPTIDETDFAGNTEGFGTFIAAMGHCVRPFNFTGLPAASIPCGFTQNGLPLSFQLVGRPFDEASILNAAHLYQKETDWAKRIPAQFA